MSTVYNDELLRQSASAKLSVALRPHLEPLPTPEHADEFGAFFDRFAGALIAVIYNALAFLDRQ